MEFIDGKITEYTPSGELTIQARYDNVERFIKCGFKEARIMLQDSRTITAEQRKKIYAMLNELSEFIGDYPDIVKKTMKWEFRLQRLEKMAADFSLSNCSVELASEFIDFLVEIIIAWGVPCKQPLIELCDNIRKYVYACLKYKKCAVCGRKADLHHVDQVGMGYDRKKIIHEGMRALPLCRSHHTEIHTIGYTEFTDKYHLEPIPLNKELCGIYKLKSKCDKTEEEQRDDAYS